MERNELCWCGSGKKYKKCHMPIEEKIMMHAERGEIVPTRKILKTPFQIEKIRKRIQTVEVDALSMNQESLAECIFPGKWRKARASYALSGTGRSI